ncbi:MAG: hypothetical protein MJ232_07790 [archaeon]|nr:hypothetical protein [archaeon]
MKKYEEEDYIIASSALNTLVSGYTHFQYPDFSYVDMYSSGISSGNIYQFNTEIKHLKSTYKYHQIKVDKIARISAATAQEIGLILMLIEPMEIYIYDVKKIDWNALKTIKQTEYKIEIDHSRGKAEYQHYIIPKSLAKKVIPRHAAGA